MKILIIGLFSFFVWSAFSSYIYVCKIKGLCYESVSVQPELVSPMEFISADTIPAPVEQKQLIMPEMLITYFAFDKSDFRAEATTDEYIKESQAFLNQDTMARLNITGYTDAIGSNQYNQALGNRRALTMQKYFESKGIPAKRIVIASKGETEPADINNTKEGRANNRRTVIIINK